jgi:hypothetical protein
MRGCPFEISMTCVSRFLELLFNCFLAGISGVGHFFLSFLAVQRSNAQLFLFYVRIFIIYIEI